MRPPARAAAALAVTLVTTVVLLGAIEAATRLTGIEHVLEARVSARLYPPEPGGENHLFATRVYDPILQWRLKPDAWLPQRIGHINSRGFVGPEFDVQKPAGETRIVSLGDSVTYGLWACGQLKFCRDTPYPEALQALLRERGIQATVVDAGVYGYSSVQGYRYYETYLGGLHANVVTAMFGWNDHGVLIGVEGMEPRSPLLRRLVAGVRHLASYRALATELALVRLPAEQPKPFIPAVYHPRVELDEFASNLTLLVEAIERRGARPLLLTEPVGPLSEPYVKGEVLQTWRLNSIEDYRTYVDVHERYNDRLRDVAERLHVPLVDADMEFERRDKTTLFSPYDIVHPNTAGHALIAHLVAQRLATEGWLASPAP